MHIHELAKKKQFKEKNEGLFTRFIHISFDHRGTITKGLLGVEGREPTAEESEKVTELKNIIFDGFLKAKESGITGGIPQYSLMKLLV